MRRVAVKQRPPALDGTHGALNPLLCCAVARRQVHQRAQQRQQHVPQKRLGQVQPRNGIVIVVVASLRQVRFWRWCWKSYSSPSGYNATKRLAAAGGRASSRYASAYATMFR